MSTRSHRDRAALVSAVICQTTFVVVPIIAIYLILARVFHSWWPALVIAFTLVLGVWWIIWTAASLGDE